MAHEELRVRVLGSAELTVGGRPLAELASVKAAALVFYLAVTGTAHPRSALAGLLWSELPEPTARANLRLVLTKLRRALPEHVVATRQTVALAADKPVWVDAAEVARAATAEHDGTDLAAAVRLCRGDLLDGFTAPGAPVFDEWLTGRRAAVRADMLAVLERALRCARDQRDTATGVEVARRMLELDQLTEEAHRALMWFLAAAGRRSAALAQYETCRYLLREELGVEPSAATSDLRDKIAAAAGFTELPGPPPVPELPRPLTSLIGRTGELDRLHALLNDPACRLVTLVGPGGIGKTRLAVEIATARREHHRDGTVFVSFVGTEDTADVVVSALARALGTAGTVPRDPLEVLTEHLAEREMLLVLDNLEHLSAAAATIAGLLRRAPATQILVTSRRRLALGAEWLVEVPGLPCPPPGAGARTAGYEAVQLFDERARLLRPGYASGSGDEDVARICRLVAGVPLAIELAARWVRGAAPRAIADRLAAGPDLLETTSADVEPRHRSLRTVIDWSCELLTAEECAVLRRLSVLRGGFDLAAATAVADAGLPVLAALADHSLITVGPDGRYSMHELLRQYAAEQLAADPAQESGTRRRHAEHFAARLSGPAEAGPEAENLRAATDWLLAHADPVTLDAHLLRLWPLYRRAGSFREATTCFGTALRRDDVTPLHRARWERLLGEAHQQLGAEHAARHHLEQALALLGRPAPVSAAGGLRVLAGQTLRRLVAGGRPQHRDDLREIDYERAAAGFTIIEVYWVLQERTPVLPTSLRALADAERAGDLDLALRCRAGLGMVLGTLGRHRLARRHLDAVTAAAERTTDPVSICWVGIVGGLHWLGTGDWTAVETVAGPVRELGRRTPMHRWSDETLLISSVAHYLTARYEQAAAVATEAMTAGRDRRDPVVQKWGLLVLIETALRTDPADPALPGWLAEAERLLPEVLGIDTGRLHVARARLALIAGDRAAAWQEIRTADHLVGPQPSLEQYALEAHAGTAEVCLALLDAGPGPGPAPAAAASAELRTTAAVAVRRLRRYASRFPMARPRALLCTGRQALLRGHHGRALRAWARAARLAEELRMPYELARAHEELGRHLAAGQRSPLGLDGAAHLAAAAAGYRAAGCHSTL
ncbi:BTAD domain-containing putative transcriptional regulator [Actinoplanes sp. NPDC048967]|uniref:ATP-binding protein n=1 Tax=Actinoplanes sp. NPDC048967 TaxID=3155269 RepID=UPI0033E2ECBB